MSTTSHDELREIALSEFARAGYGSTSLQRIAEIAGLSKSSVLYHYSSKDALLEAAVTPALERFEAMVAALEGSTLDTASRDRFVTAFVDLILDHTREVHLFINQGPSLEDVPVIERANALVVRIAAFFATSIQQEEYRMRFGIALGGAAYMLVSRQQFHLETEVPKDEIRAALVTIVTELLAPIPSTATPE